MAFLVVGIALLYFSFFFVLFGSTVMIPQLLQSLYGYTATDAGLVLGPGAFVIVMMAPLVVRLIPKIGAKKMIVFAAAIIGLSMWRYGSLDPGTDYPPHRHAGIEELHLLDGELLIDDRELHPGDYNRAEPGTVDHRVWSKTGCTCVLITSPDDVLR